MARNDTERLTKLERETIIIFNEEESDAAVCTYNSRLKRKLEGLASKAPEQVRLINCDGAGCVKYILPKTCISLRPPYSEERRQADRERALQAGRRPPGDRSE